MKLLRKTHFGSGIQDQTAVRNTLFQEDRWQLRAVRNTRAPGPLKRSRGPRVFTYGASAGIACTFRRV